MDTHIIWAILLLAAAFVLFFLEFFVPSAGMLLLAAFGCLAGGIFFLFKVNTTLGMVGAIVCIGALPLVFALGLKTFPNTPIFRLLNLTTEQRTVMGEHGIAGAEARTIAETLTGKTGKALTDLHPVGTCLIDGQRVDCVASAGIIRAGKQIRVVAADGLQIKVMEVEA